MIFPQKQSRQTFNCARCAHQYSHYMVQATNPSNFINQNSISIHSPLKLLAYHLIQPQSSRINKWAPKNKIK